MPSFNFNYEKKNISIFFKFDRYNQKIQVSRSGSKQTSNIFKYVPSVNDVAEKKKADWYVKVNVVHTTVEVKKVCMFQFDNCCLGNKKVANVEATL